MQIRRVLAGTAITLAVMTAACSTGSEDPPGPANAQRASINLTDPLTFAPRSLSVESNRPVVLTVHSTTGTEHDFSIVAMPASDVITRNTSGHTHGANDMIVGHPKAGSDVTIQFTPTQPGSYEFFCSIPGHREAGMTGMITVS